MGMSIYFLGAEEEAALVKLGGIMEKADPLDDDDSAFEAFDTFVMERHQGKVDLTDDLDLAEGYVAFLVDRWIPDFDRPWLTPGEAEAAVVRWQKLVTGKELARLLNPARRGAATTDDVTGLHRVFLEAVQRAAEEQRLLVVLYS